MYVYYLTSCSDQIRKFLKGTVSRNFLLSKYNTVHVQSLGVVGSHLAQLRFLEAPEEPLALAAHAGPTTHSVKLSETWVQLFSLF